VWGNTNSLVVPPSAASHSDIELPGPDPYNGTGNLNRNPWFRNPADDDYRLQTISPCLAAAAEGGDMGAVFPVGANPVAPESLTLVNSVLGSTNRVLILWTDRSDDEHGFEIHRRGSGDAWRLVCTTGPDVTNYADAAVQQMAGYEYRVRAFHDRGQSLYSPRAAITSSADAYTQSLMDNLRITEIMYNPVGQDDAEEFIEYKNISTTETIDLSGATVDNDRFVFPEGATLSPQAFFVLARNATAFEAAYGFPPDGVFLVDDKLDNGGETLWVRDSLGNKVYEVEYGDGGDPGWYPTTDGEGHSLVPVDTNPDGVGGTP
jgi:hypothetical protein